MWIEDRCDALVEIPDGFTYGMAARIGYHDLVFRLFPQLIDFPGEHIGRRDMDGIVFGKKIVANHGEVDIEPSLFQHLLIAHGLRLIEHENTYSRSFLYCALDLSDHRRITGCL